MLRDIAAQKQYSPIKAHRREEEEEKKVSNDQSRVANHSFKEKSNQGYKPAEMITPSGNYSEMET